MQFEGNYSLFGKGFIPSEQKLSAKGRQASFKVGNTLNDQAQPVAEGKVNVSLLINIE